MGTLIDFILRSPWIIPALPLASFATLALSRAFLPRSVLRGVAGFIGTMLLFLATFASYGLAYGYFHLAPDLSGTRMKLVPWAFEWLPFQVGLSVQLGTLVDSISVMMCTVVTSVSFLVHLYSTSYMHDDEGVARYFTYLGLFTFSMLGLVLAPNLFQMYVFWELVGVSSFLLIGFYFQKPSAVAASKKAFIVTRFADLGFLIGIMILGYEGFRILPVDPLAFSFLTGKEHVPQLADSGLLTLALILVYMGAAGKSAMFPLHIWLPDAMEGPTPVSALIHAATMVVAGVYLVARMFPAFAAAPAALEVVAWVGLFTSAFAAIIACTQNDIKRVLAFSTLSQLGYMMFALGITTLDEPLGFTASLFHLYTHAFFKALLFLGAGAVIHAVHSNSIWDMGGLRKSMPITHFTFAIAVLAIAGIFPFSGFFSKDEILVAALDGHRYLHFAGGLVVAGLTAFYMARIYFVTFWGHERTEGAHHAHEAPLPMLIPLILLALMTCVCGWIPFGELVSLGTPLAHEAPRYGVIALGTLAAFIGLGSAAYFYASGSSARAEQCAKRFGAFYRWASHKFYIDEVYQFVTHRIIFAWVARPIAWFDRNIVDGAVNLTGSITRGMSVALTLFQTGQVQTYLFWSVLGVVLMLLLNVRGN